MKINERLSLFLDRQREKGRYRSLKYHGDLVDFSSNDYLGLSQNEQLLEMVQRQAQHLPHYGATGSRLLTGQHPLMDALEQQLSGFHQSESALLFNSGYDANLALLSTIPRKGDLILYDELVHASMHDGMRLGKADTMAFSHNDPQDLADKLSQRKTGQLCFVLLESLYSMDGDIPPLEEILEICERFEANLIIDEAHATGILGPRGAGLVQALGLQGRIFARLHTFGKSIGGHGAVVLGSALLRNYLINFARPLIFSTAMPLHSLLHIQAAYQLLKNHGDAWLETLSKNIQYFRSLLSDHPALLPSSTPIQGLLVPGNKAVLDAAAQLQSAGFDIRPIRVPTVAAGRERLRICLHLQNTKEEIGELAKIINNI